MRRTNSLLSAQLMQLENRLAPAIINFSITMASSSLTLSGSVDGNPISEQQAGSLTAKYTGTIQVDVDFTNNTIQFIGIGTSAKASNFGSNLSPAVGGGTALFPGSAPANYGGKATVTLPTTVAGRNMIAAFDSGVLTLSGAGPSKSFPSTQSVTLTSGTVDYNNFLLQGSESLIGQSGTNAAVDGTFTDLGNGNYALTLPANATINDVVNGLPLVLNIVGTINGTAVLPIVDLNGANVGFDSTFTHTAGGAATKIAPLATITRSPAANLTGMTVTLVSPPDGIAESLTADLTGTVGLSTTGYDAVTGQLTISGSGSLATYQSVLQKITYADINSNGTPGVRTVTVTVTDGGNSSLPRTTAGTVNVPPAHVQFVEVNDGIAVQRSQVTSITVVFDKHVALPATPADAFTLTKNDSSPVNLTAAVDDTGATTVVTLSFTGGSVDGTSLADGRYNLTVLGNQVNGGNFDGGGGPMSNYTLIGDPTVAPKLYRLFGDSDGDNVVSSTDFSAFRGVFGTMTGSFFDSNGDGNITSEDFAAFRRRFGTGV